MESDSSTKFSPSKLDTYKDCPRRYQYRYVDKIKREEKSVEAFLGTCVHSALESLYESLAHGKKLSLAAVVKLFEAEWDKGWSDAIVIRSKEYAEKDWKKVGKDCVRAYYEANDPFDRDRTVEVEKRVGFPLLAAGEECRIEGFVDRLAIGADGAFEIHDYKTSRTLPSQEEKDRDWQLAIYELAVRHAWPDAMGVRLIWHYLRFGKSIVSTRTPEQLAALKADISGLIETIRRDHSFEPRKSALCDWCEYRDLCPLWSHAAAVAALPPERRRQDDGVRLVDQYAALEAKKRDLREDLKRLEKEEDGLREELIAFAAERGLSAVAGLEGEISIVEKDEYRFPGKTHSPQALEALEKDLKGSPLWGEVSKFDGGLLLEGLRRKAWPEALLELGQSLVERYAKHSREKLLRFHKKTASDEE